MIIIWPFGLDNAYDLLVGVGSLNAAELLSVMVTIYSP